MRRLPMMLEILSSLVGFIWLFGPPGWEGASRGVTVFLSIVIIIAVIAGISLLWMVVAAQLQKPWKER